MLCKEEPRRRMEGGGVENTFVNSKIQLSKIDIFAVKTMTKRDKKKALKLAKFCYLTHTRFCTTAARGKFALFEHCLCPYFFG